MNYKIWSFISIFLFIVCLSLFYFLYKAEKERTIEELNARQLVHAKQAAKGLEQYIDSWLNQFSILAGDGEIVNLTPGGKKQIDSFYEARKNQLGSVVRVDEKGTIIYAPPQLKITNKNILYEQHIKDIIKYRKPVISDVFYAVQGYNAIAIHVPVLRNGKFDGSIGGILKVEAAGKKFLEDIRIGESGYAWMISRDGTELYSPVPGSVGKSVYETSLDDPDMLAMAKKMMAGDSGLAVYNYAPQKNKVKGKRYAVYVPVHIPNTNWSIVVSTAEGDVLNSLINYRNKLFFIIITFFAAGTFFAYYGMKTWGIIKESEARKEAELELQKLNSELEAKIASRTQQLEKTNKDLESLTYAISHDLRAPMRAINGYLLALKEDYTNKPLDNEGVGFLERIKKSALKMDELIDGILRLSRLNYHSLDYTDLNITAMARSIAKEIQSAYQDKAFELKVEDALEARGDYGLITQLLEALLSNACKFSSKTAMPAIELKRVERNGKIVFALKDNGTGFISENNDKIFAPFRRFHSEFEFPGIGLGLSIAKKIIEKHRGVIWIESAPDKGTTVYFTL